ncbi:MAG: class A beta-lactamase-related serine hydrolase [Chitinophagaceae bacterium]|nr:MAG: class A beta-lactamase-related serine hydrolase [Chitinophagaceae bacterium]
MKLILKTVACFSILVCFFASKSSIAQQKKYTPAIEARIKAVEDKLTGRVQIKDSNNYHNLQQRMKAEGVNGVSIAVINNYQVEWVKAYGFADVASGKKVTNETLFQAASISKSLNALGLLKLAQLKKIDLDTDVNNYLHSWKFPYDSVSKGKKITVTNLLSHTAGTSVHGFGGYETTDTLPTIIQILNGQKPANNDPVRSQREPGKASVYSGGGTTISQLLVTDVQSQPYEDFMWQYVLKPIGMMSSSFAQPALKNKIAQLSTGYAGNGKSVKSNYHVYPEQAAAGLWTNPTDLAKFIIEIQRSLQGKSNKVLDTAFTRKYVTPVVAGAALGNFIIQHKDTKYFNHGGANEGFRCVYYGSIEGGNGVVVMLNSDNGRMMEEIANSVSIVYQWKDFYNPIIKTTVAVPAETLKLYEGKYEIGGDTVSVNITGQPKLIINNQEIYPIYFSSQDEFFSTDLPFNLKFEKDEAGKVKGIYFKNNGGEQRARKL